MHDRSVNTYNQSATAIFSTSGIFVHSGGTTTSGIIDLYSLPLSHLERVGEVYWGTVDVKVANVNSPQRDFQFDAATVIIESNKTLTEEPEDYVLLNSGILQELLEQTTDSRPLEDWVKSLHDI